MSGSQFFSWRSAVLQSDLPSTTRLVLLVLSTYMDDHGGGCFPSMETIAEGAGLSKRAVITQIATAEKAGFIRISKHGFGGQKWARNEYRIAFPRPEAGEGDSPAQDAEVVKEVHQLGREGGERGSSSFRTKVVNLVPEGGEPDDTKVVNDVHSNSPMNSPVTSPTSADAEVCARARDAPSAVRRGITDWSPRETTLAALTQTIPEQFVREQLIEFATYWQDRGLPATSWDAKFISRCSRQWRIHGHEWQAQGSAGNRATDRREGIREAIFGDSRNDW